MLGRARRQYDDALSRMAPEELEALLAVHYRNQGYQVEHVGNGKPRRRFQGGIDLKLHRGAELLVVECRHWNARRVPQSVVHQLIGLMVNEGATGAVVISSGEFTAAARAAAQRLGQVQLVDGDALRSMLGPLPVGAAKLAPFSGWRDVAPSHMRTWPRPGRAAMGRMLGGALVALVVVLLLAWQVRAQHDRNALAQHQQQQAADALHQQQLRARIAAQRAAAIAQARADAEALARTQAAAAAAVPVLPVAPPAAPPTIQFGMTEEEKAEWDRQNAESMKVIEGHTPKM